MNRSTRRASQKYFKKQLKTAEWSELKPYKQNEAEIKFAKKRYFDRFMANDILSAQTYIIPGEWPILIGIRRHDQRKSISWSTKQRVKNELFGEESIALEVFPPESKLIDQANIYWIWVFTSPERTIDLSRDLDLERYISHV
jgi:hypothetical protein